MKWVEMVEELEWKKMIVNQFWIEKKKMTMAKLMKEEMIKSRISLQFDWSDPEQPANVRVSTEWKANTGSYDTGPTA
jgi:hypothetical protein